MLECSSWLTGWFAVVYSGVAFVIGTHNFAPNKSREMADAPLSPQFLSSHPTATQSLCHWLLTATAAMQT